MCTYICMSSFLLFFSDYSSFVSRKNIANTMQCLFIFYYFLRLKIIFGYIACHVLIIHHYYVLYYFVVAIYNILQHPTTIVIPKGRNPLFLLVCIFDHFSFISFFHLNFNHFSKFLRISRSIRNHFFPSS
jgi:hypothetical protein